MWTNSAYQANSNTSPNVEAHMGGSQAELALNGIIMGVTGYILNRQYEV